MKNILKKLHESYHLRGSPKLNNQLITDFLNELSVKDINKLSKFIDKFMEEYKKGKKGGTWDVDAKKTMIK